MSFVIAQPEMIAAAAGELASIRSAINAANAAAAAQTTGVMSAAADEVSTAVAALFSSHAQAYQAASAQAAAFHAQVVRTLTVDAGAYASAEAANAGPNMLAAVNAPAQALLGRPLIGNGANGAPGTGQAGGDGGLLFGNGGNGGSGAPGPGRRGRRGGRVLRQRWQRRGRRGRSERRRQRLQDAGKTKRAALRCLKRRLARTVFQALRTVHQPSSEHTQPAAACHRSYCSSHLGEPPRLTDMTQKTRIQPLPPKRAGLLIRALYRIAKRRFGEVPEPFTVTAHHRRLLIANVVHEALLQRASRKLPPSVRELAVFWTARSIGCSWCVDFGAMLQRLDGLDVDRLTDIDNYATSSKFSDDERAAIAYAEAMTADPHSVTDEQVADLRARFGEAGVIELTYQIGVENMRARMNSALGITEQGFNSGDACRVPWAAPDVPSAESR